MKKTKILASVFVVIAAVLVLSLSAFAVVTDHTENDFEYTVLEDDTVKITAYNGADTVVSIPDEIDGMTVTAIGDEVFWDMSDIESITIPETVTSIGKLAFASCGRLTSLDLPQGLISIGDSAFDMCGVNSLTIPETVTSIGKDAFFYTRMSAITVDEDNEYYSSDEYGVLFNKDKTELIKYPCGSEITEYIIPDTVTSVAGASFIWARNLKSVTIPNKVTEIKQDTFSECDALETVVISDSVEKIYSNAFAYSNIKTLTIGSGLKEIDHNAFTSDFEDVYYNGTQGQWNRVNIAYSNTGFKNANIHFKECDPHSFTKYYSNYDATYAADGTKTAYCDNLCGAKNTVTDEGTRKPLATTSKLTFTAATNSVTLKWNAVEGAGGYRVFVKNTVTDKWDIAVRTTGKKTTATIDGLESGTKYTFAVRAYVNNGKIVWAPKYKSINTLTKPGVTGKITGTSAADSVTLKWNKVTGATGYRVYILKSGKWSTLKTTTATSYTVTGLSQGTKYTFAVKAYTKYNGEYYWASSYKRFETATVPSVTKSIKVTKSATEYVTLKWEAVKGATGYRVYVYNSQTKKWETSVKATTKLTANVKNLVPGRSYNFAVKAFTRTDSGDIWAKSYTKITGKTADMTDDYARKLFCEASKVDIKWWPAFYVAEGSENQIDSELRDYFHIVDPYDYIEAEINGYSYYFYAVVDSQIKSKSQLKALMSKYFDEDYVEHCLMEFKDYNGKLYTVVYDFDYELASYYTDSIKKISSTHYRYYLKAHFENGAKGSIKNIYYDLVLENGKWVFTTKYEDKRYNGEKADNVDYFYPILLAEYIVKD